MTIEEFGFGALDGVPPEVLFPRHQSAHKKSPKDRHSTAATFRQAALKKRLTPFNNMAAIPGQAVLIDRPSASLSMSGPLDRLQQARDLAPPLTWPATLPGGPQEHPDPKRKFTPTTLHRLITREGGSLNWTPCAVPLCQLACFTDSSLALRQRGYFESVHSRVPYSRVFSRLVASHFASD